MPQLVFRTGIFLRTILFYLVATAGWTWYVIKCGMLAANEDDIRVPLGFLLILAVSLVIGAGRFCWEKVIAVTAGVILVFLVATVVLGGSLTAMRVPVWIYFILNSVFVAFVMTWLIGGWGDDFPFRRWTIVLTAVCMLMGYLLYYFFWETLREDYNIETRVSIFLFLQTPMVLPLALGLALKEAEAPA